MLTDSVTFILNHVKQKAVNSHAWQVSPSPSSKYVLKKNSDWIFVYSFEMFNPRKLISVENDVQEGYLLCLIYFSLSL